MVADLSRMLLDSSKLAPFRACPDRRSGGVGGRSGNPADKTCTILFLYPYEEEECGSSIFNILSLTNLSKSGSVTQ
jgi:hypothetical protein